MKRQKKTEKAGYYVVDPALSVVFRGFPFPLFAIRRDDGSRYNDFRYWTRSRDSCGVSRSLKWES